MKARTNLPLPFQLLLVFASVAFGQGGLTPPAGPPAPTQKSLQEIWDRIGDLETENAELRAELETNREATDTGMRLLLEDAGIPLPWKQVYAEGSVKNFDFAFHPSTGYPVIVADTNTRFRIWEHDGTSFQETAISALPDGEVSLAFFGTRIIAAYLDGSTVKFAKEETDGSFSVETVGSSNGNDAHLSIAILGIGASGEVGISYNSDTDDLAYAYKLGVDSIDPWTSTIVDSAGDTGYNTDLVQTVFSRPIICYHDGTQLKAAYRNSSNGGGTWSTSVVDGTAGAGAEISAIPYSSTTYVAYYNSTTDEIRYASFPYTDPTSGTRELIAASVSSNGDVSIKRTPAGLPAVAYRSSSTIDYAVRAATNTWEVETATTSAGSGAVLDFRADDEPAVAVKISSNVFLVHKGLFGTPY